MTDFDELLRHVLQQQANPKLPSGMRARLMDGRVLERARDGSNRGRRFGLALVAAVLAGLTTLALWRIMPWRSGPTPRDLMKLNVTQTLVGRGTEPAVPRRRVSLERSVVVVSPIKIDSIAIRSIKIPELKIPKLKQKGKMR